MDLFALQNGSDIRGVAYGGASPALTSEAAVRIGRAFALYIADRLGREGVRVSIGRDPRITGVQLLNDVSAGLRRGGADVVQFALASTPAMFMSTVKEGGYDGAVMITASHLPPDRNGMKFFVRGSGLEKRDIAAILDIASAFDDCTAAPYAPPYEDYMAEYSAHLCDIIRRGAKAEDYERPLLGYRIVVDAGNGGGGFFAHRVLKPLGADVSHSVLLEPDGTFPNHSPNPEDHEAMAFLSQRTVEAGADMGIMFDPDVDRAAVVLSSGMEVNRNRLVALLAAIALRSEPGGTIVTDSITSSGLGEFIRGLGGVHRRFKRGYRNVINEAVRLNAEGVRCPLAMETSGHAALRENYFLDDGAYLVAKLLIELARCKRDGSSLEALIAGLNEPAERREVRLKLTGQDFKRDAAGALARFAELCEADPAVEPERENYEGIRANMSEYEGWFLLRMSLHDPVMPLNIESDAAGGVKRIARHVLTMLKGMRAQGVDLSALEALAE
ncbi:MAG: phosphomannomutase/phosphoglucomutase [Clostridia bacterium]|nr:phosphomannomutase/phosphoglucomutase [Clostridia bacterium]